MESITDKVIKNTFYYFLSQLISLVFPIILIPFIISKIGEVEFGIFTLVFGFIGTFNLFDLSISVSFIKFISEYYNKKETEELNRTINTGLYFYTVFSLIFLTGGYLFSDFFISLVNIPEQLYEKSLYIFRLSLIIFFIATSTTVFVSVLTSLQKSYYTSFTGIILNILSFTATIIFLNAGYGLSAIVLIQLISVIISTAMNIYLTMRLIPNLKLGFKYAARPTFKKMSVFGIQVQVSRAASFLSEKYDEFLLAIFSVLNNVTYFNIAGRIARAGRFLPYQMFIQAAPVAAELNAKNENEKLNKLFKDITRYMNIVTLPIFIYLFIFSDLIVETWMGKGYEISSAILRILIAGQVINLTFSAPGNSIIPNTGIPKYSMIEGLINLGINLLISYFLIKNYGIYGAAIGSTAAIIISSFYIFYSSLKFFKFKTGIFYKTEYVKPLISSIMSGSLTYILFFLFNGYFLNIEGRTAGIITIILTFIILFGGFIYSLLKLNYITYNDKIIFLNFLKKIIPIPNK